MSYLNGYFVMEGVDGSGKTTQISRVKSCTMICANAIWR